MAKRLNYEKKLIPRTNTNWIFSQKYSSKNKPMATTKQKLYLKSLGYNETMLKYLTIKDASKKIDQLKKGKIK